MKPLVTVVSCLLCALTASGQATKKFKTLAELETAMARERLAALEAFVKDAAGKEEADLKQAKGDVAELKVMIELKGDANAGALKDVHGKFLAQLEAEAVRHAFEVTNEVAERLVDLDDVAAAKDAWKALETRFGDHPQAGGQVKGIVERETADLELIGTDPKGFKAKDLKEAEVSIEQFKGKVLLLDFWATWCGPCVAELPNVIAAYKKFHGKGFEILGISLDKEDKTALDKFLAAHPDMTWQQVYDGKFWKAELAQLYGVQSIPATYLIDQNGKIYRIGVRGKALEKAVERLLSKGAPKPKAQPAK